MDHIQDIKDGSEWEVMIDGFSIGVGSHSQNPNTTKFPIKKHTVIKWDGDSRDGKCWFIVYDNGKNTRGYIECGIITNLIKNNRISLYDMGNGHVVYRSNYVSQLLGKNL